MKSFRHKMTKSTNYLVIHFIRDFLNLYSRTYTLHIHNLDETNEMKGGLLQSVVTITTFSSLLAFVFGATNSNAYITHKDQDRESQIQTCNDQNEVKGSCTTADARNRTGLVEDMIPFDDAFECGIYLAPSSIPNAGFGIFTTRSIGKNDKIQPYSESPSIVVTDFYEHAGNEEQDWNHVDYVWEPVGFNSFEAEESSISVMTFGSLCNYHPVSYVKIDPSFVVVVDSKEKSNFVSYHNRIRF